MCIVESRMPVVYDGEVDGDDGWCAMMRPDDVLDDDDDGDGNDDW